MAKCNASFLVEIIFTSSDSNLSLYFVQLSGENPELGNAEIKSLVRLLPYRVTTFRREKIVLARGERSPVDFFLERAALARRGGIVLGELSYGGSITENVLEERWRENVLPSDRFSVRTECVDTQFDLAKRLEIEKNLGRHIQNITQAKVDLEKPTVNILVIILPNQILICKSRESRLRQLLRVRGPGKKPFFHPSMMNSILARVMCNLAGVKPGNIVFDPFCGAGGILCEAAYIGATGIGTDLNWRLLQGARRNLEEITAKYSIIQGDAVHPPLRVADNIVTDPPYGRSSSTRGNESRDLFESILSTAPDILRPGEENLCICGSTEIDLPRMVQSMGYDIGIDIKEIVHSGLVREIVTVKL